MKAKTVPFSSLMFLKTTPKELVRKRRLKDRLLMAARMAILGLLALAFARPYMPSEDLPFIPQRESESVVVLLDRSFSMRQDGAFEEATRHVRGRLDGAGAGDEFALLTFADDVQVMAPLDTDLAAHRAALETLEAGYRSTDYFPPLQRAKDILQEASHRRQVVVLVSDYQDSGWSGALDNFELGEGVLLETVPVAAGGEGNVYVEDFRLDRRRVEGRYAARLDARIAMSGRDESARGYANETGSSDASTRADIQPSEAAPENGPAAAGAIRVGRSIALIVDGSEVAQQPVAERASAPASFQHRVEREGYYQGSLVLSGASRGNSLTDDDRFYFTDLADALPGVLIVDAPSSLSRRDGFFLRSAFDLGDESRFRLSAEGAVSEPVLRRNDVLFLSNRAAASERERSDLRRFTENGGTVVISAGNEVEPADLTRTLEALEVGRIQSIVDAREEFGYEAIIGEVDRRHPVFQPFAAEGRAGSILRPKFRRYARLDPFDGTTIVGRFDSGDVFLAERRLGSGVVLFYASTFNTGWTDMPLDEMYVPFVYQIAGYGAGQSDETHQFHVGDVVLIDGRPGETWEIQTPGGRLHRVTLDDSGKGFFRDTDVPGHYAAAGGGGTRMFSVNIDPRESNLRLRDAEEVYAAVVTPSNDTATTPEEAAAAVIETDERQQKLWRVILLLVLALFVVETYFANRRSAERKRSGAAGGATPPDRISKIRSKTVVNHDSSIFNGNPERTKAWRRGAKTKT